MQYATECLQLSPVVLFRFVWLKKKKKKSSWVILGLISSWGVLIVGLPLAELFMGLSMAVAIDCLL